MTATARNPSTSGRNLRSTPPGASAGGCGGSPPVSASDSVVSPIRARPSRRRYGAAMPRPLRTETLTDELPAPVGFLELAGMTARASSRLPPARTAAEGILDDGHREWGLLLLLRGPESNALPGPQLTRGTREPGPVCLTAGRGLGHGASDPPVRPWLRTASLMSPAGTLGDKSGELMR